jgi:hypothetical protein
VEGLGAARFRSRRAGHRFRRTWFDLSRRMGRWQMTMWNSLITNGVLAQVAEQTQPTMVDNLVAHLLSAVIFAAVGLVVFGISLWLFVRLSPFSVRKEIEEDHNVALAIILAALLIGISMIIAAAIQG